ncbi:MAG: hypothetical protein DRH43_02800 [Deltaproteobacteria bacterium]|nr:MAG: hypothetical protein DRH43_02800 [Deltaproteobacteria bacterium]
MSFFVSTRISQAYREEAHTRSCHYEIFAQPLFTPLALPLCYSQWHFETLAEFRFKQFAGLFAKKQFLG